MPGEKKPWKLPTPFRRFSGKPDSLLKTQVEHSRRRVSSVYLSDDSTNGFIIVPEFDDPARIQTKHEEFFHESRSSTLPTMASSIPDSVGSLSCTYLGGGSYDASAVNASQNDDLVQRLGSAYEHIRSMPSAATPEVVLSSDPQTRRKQLGVPQHSVSNYPIHSSPDLPNPHTSLSDPPSPSLPLAIPQDVSPGGRLKKRKHPNVCPPSRRWFSKPSQIAQMKPASNTPTGTEESISQCSSLGARRSPHIARFSKPRPSAVNSCHVEKVTPTFRPSPGRPEVNGALRKPVSGTAPPAPAGRQIYLPQIRSPSPFRVDIPLHHTWHDRRFDFSCPPGFISKANPRRTSGSTEMLASLAWIGSPRIPPDPYPANHRRQSASTTCLSDRFDIAAVVEDDSMSDDALVDRLEKVRRIDGSFQPDRDTSLSKCLGNSHFLISREDENATDVTYTSSPLSLSPVLDPIAEPRDVPPLSPLVSNNETSESEDAVVWKAARKAVLCIREIIRTEKKYQEALKMLLNAQTATPPPPSMIPHVSALVRASEMLLKSFLEDPSAWGVSTAFVTSEDELEATMVSWCAVVGTFFTDGDNHRPSGLVGKWRLRKSGGISSSPPVPNQTAIISSPQLPPVFAMVNAANKNKERASGEYHTSQHMWTEPMRRQSNASLQKLEKANSQAPSRKLSVRDLAIQPIQRVMRYVLLYRDLLDCTLTVSPSRLLVERALEAAMCIAERCDKAQRNPAFYRVS
ncbi:hypothetical protein JVU11DRAFT_4925 [Chiua virens]|nr:hypothetical protein JVU11DRAFT_4925 [Chiua virens]